jgi:hypothetical protein
MRTSALDDDIKGSETAMFDRDSTMSGTLDLMTLALEVGQAGGRCAALIGDRKYRFEIVDASRYQARVEAAAAARADDSTDYYSAALLFPERTNPGSVSVRLNTGIVGFLRKDLAPLFLNGLREGRFDMAVCGAVIAGLRDRAGLSSGNLTVRLDAFVPFRFEDPRSRSLRP